MNRALVIFPICILVGCANTKEYCYVDLAEREVLLNNIRPVLQGLESESIRYVPAPSFARDGRLYSDEKGCFIYILPEAKDPSYGILDGDGGIYINVGTLKPERTFWHQH